MPYKKIGTPLIVILFLVYIFSTKTTYQYTYNDPNQSLSDTTWGDYIFKYDSTATDDLTNHDEAFLLQNFGIPTVVITQERHIFLSKETQKIFIYRTDWTEDSESVNALYVYMTNGSIENYRLDDFLGVDTSILPSYFQ